MGAIVGVLLGYYLGVRAGPGGYEELMDAWKTISTSAEVRDIVAGGFSMARDLGRRGTELLSSRLAEGDGLFPRVA